MLDINYISDIEISPAWEKVVKDIREHGIDSPDVFGHGSFGGYLIQQNAEEFASLICVMKRHLDLKNYLETGSASGGNLRFIYENVGFDRVISFDDRKHSAHIFQEKNSILFADKITRFIGNSHSEEAANALKNWIQNEKIDFAFIDGDHSEEGVLSDFKMVKPYLTKHSLVVFHDTIAVPTLGSSVNKLLTTGILKLQYHFVSNYKPCGILVCTLI